MIIYRSDITVEILDQAGSDRAIAEAAWVSTGSYKGDESVPGLIRYLMKHRHGTPFEHGFLSIRVQCPIFIAREWMRHRVGWSYNEVSGRYRKLEPIFWLPKPDRPLLNTGNSARPRMERGVTEDAIVRASAVKETGTCAARNAWKLYELQLELGVASEVARAVLPISIYTEFRATCNPRSLMHFLSLRTHNPSALFASYPMLEIEEAARQLEYALGQYWPETYAAFIGSGYVVP